MLFRRSARLVAKYLRKVADTLDTLANLKSVSLEDLRQRARYVTYRMEWFCRAMKRSGMMESYEVDAGYWHRADYLPFEEMFYRNTFYLGAKVVLRNRVSPTVAVIVCPDRDKLSTWDGYGTVAGVKDDQDYDVSIDIYPEQWPQEVWHVKGYAMMWLDESKVVTAHEKALRMMKRRKLI